MRYEYKLQKGQVKVKRHKQSPLMLKYSHATHSNDVQEQDHTSVTPLPVRCLERLYCPSICLFSFLVHGTSNSQTQVTNKHFDFRSIHHGPTVPQPLRREALQLGSNLPSPQPTARPRGQRFYGWSRNAAHHVNHPRKDPSIPASDYTVDSIHSTQFLSSAAICRLYCSRGCWSFQAHQLYIRANFGDLRLAQSHLRP